MRKLFVFLFVFFGMAFQVAAQTTPAPTSVLTHFSMSVTATGIMGNGSESAMIAGADFQLTKDVGVEYEQIIASNATFDLGNITYTRPLSQLLGKNITSKLLFDASGWNVTAFAGAGRVVDVGKHAAETAGLRLSCPLNSNVTFRMISVQWLHGPQYNAAAYAPSTAAISSGLQINF